MSIRRLDGAERERAIPELAAILADWVQGGASVGFLLPFTAFDAETYWRVAAPTTLVLDRDSDSDAVRLYRGLGWEESGSVPRYCVSADGRLKATTFMHKLL
jgi:hypothetical protein